MSGIIWVFVACGFLGLLYAMDAVGMIGAVGIRDRAAGSGEERDTRRPWSRFAIAAGICVPYGFVLAPVLVLGIVLGCIFGMIYNSFMARRGMKTGELKAMSLLGYFALLFFGAAMWGYKALAMVFTPMRTVLRSVGAISPREP